MKYRNKPVVIEAVQYRGFASPALLEHLETADYFFSEDGIEPPFMTIETLEGQHTALINDFIIKGVKGEFYPCKPDIFDLTYELVEGTEG